MNHDSYTCNIVYSADDKFAEILGVSLLSLYENSKNMEDINVFVLDSDISEENKSKLNSISKKYNRKQIVFLKIKKFNEILPIKLETDRGSLSQYSRIFISSVLPKHLSRVIYLDCDTIVRKSIFELWNINLNGKTIGALKDAFSKYYRRNIGLNENDIMFNSGVLIIDLDKWKNNLIEEKILQFIIQKNGKIQQGDQGALNSVLSAETYCFDPKYNSVTIFYDFTYEEMIKYRKPVDFYSKSEILKSVEDPYIIHFTTSFISKRPWFYGCEHKYASEWLKYRKLSPWNNDLYWKNDIPKNKKIILKIYHFFPKRFSFAIASLMQIYCRPFFYYIFSLNKRNSKGG